MNNLILLTAALVVATKVLDCLSTLAAVHHVNAETNPVARAGMRRLGIRGTIALVFVLATSWTLALTWAALAFGGPVVQALFVAAGLSVAVVQAAVAHTNWTGRWNLVTRRVLTWHRLLARAGQRWLATRAVRGA